MLCYASAAIPMAARGAYSPALDPSRRTASVVLVAVEALSPTERGLGTLDASERSASAVPRAPPTALAAVSERQAAVSALCVQVLGVRLRATLATSRACEVPADTQQSGRAARQQSRLRVLASATSPASTDVVLLRRAASSPAFALALPASAHRTSAVMAKACAELRHEGGPSLPVPSSDRLAALAQARTDSRANAPSPAASPAASVVEQCSEAETYMKALPSECSNSGSEAIAAGLAAGTDWQVHSAGLASASKSPTGTTERPDDEHSGQLRAASPVSQPPGREQVPVSMTPPPHTRRDAASQTADLPPAPCCDIDTFLVSVCSSDLQSPEVVCLQTMVTLRPCHKQAPPAQLHGPARATIPCAAGMSRSASSCSHSRACR